MLLALLAACDPGSPVLLVPKLVILPPELRVGERSLPIRSAPSPDAPLRGYTAADASFYVLGRAGDEGCEAGWGILQAGGYLCLEGTTRATRQAEPWPPLVLFDPPEPSEYDEYVQTGEYDHRSPERIAPAVYAKRWKRFEGNLYASLDAFLDGEGPVGKLAPGAGNKYRFERILETEKGPVLQREDGRVARLDDVYLYPVSRLRGIDLLEDPMPEGALPALTIDPEGAPLRTAEGELALRVPYHTALAVSESDGRWYAHGIDPSPLEIDRSSFRVASRSPESPSGLADGERWIDIDLAEQTLVVYEGDEPIYVTLVSTGASGTATPIGTWQIYEKHGLKDMVSRPGAADPYRVEDVPWTMMFKPRYALHTAYWHWGFGRPASHGCVNLAPFDAAWLYENVGAPVPAGWRIMYTTREEGGVVRIRRGDVLGEDHRGEANEG